MIYPLVFDLAAVGIPVVVTCRVLKFTPQAFYKWRANPVSARDWDDAHLVMLHARSTPMTRPSASPSAS
jgi:hypothetical protein